MAMETNYLVPGGGFLLSVAVYAILLVIHPTIGAARQGRWGWVVAIVLLSPIAGLLWHAQRLHARHGCNLRPRHDVSFVDTNEKR